ncbi:MAG: TatD family hydrolase [Verrucomicrobia bacterium]|nr:TatD family hydrolase [Verrucomicrobiota bacterium]
MLLFDAHNHLHFPALQPHRAAVLADLSAIGLGGAVVNGTSEDEWPIVSALCARHSTPNTQLLPSYGLHPWDAGNRTPAWLDTLRTRLIAEPASHVGEIGLDRWIIDDLRPDDPRLAGLRVASLDEQAEVFRAQLALAAELGRAASLHCLRAIGPLHEILRTAKLPARGFLLHAYSGPLELVRPLAGLGAYFSYNGHFLRARHAAKSRVFAAVPPDRLLVETDAPAMELPAPHARFALPAAPDGQAVNHPANLAATYAALAELRNVPLASLAGQVARNFVKLFGTTEENR